MAVEPNLTPLWWTIILFLAFVRWILYRVQYPRPVESRFPSIKCGRSNGRGYQQIDGKIFSCPACTGKSPFKFVDDEGNVYESDSDEIDHFIVADEEEELEDLYILVEELDEEEE